MKFVIFTLGILVCSELIFQGFVYAIAVESTARRRLGKKSFIRKQEENTLKKIATPDELNALASTFVNRTPGSNSFWKGWLTWRIQAIESIRYDLSQSLPHPTDKIKFENLFFRLGVAADMGEMPSFSDAGARSGYALEFFARARNLGDLYIDALTLNSNFAFPCFWLESMLETPMVGADGQEPYHMVSLGGGPGFDFVGAALASSFSAKTSEKVQSRTIEATILDYEEGWGDLVEAMGRSTSRILQEPFSCKWGGKCDITKPLNDPSNSACFEAMDATQLWTCQYCVAENAKLLRESKHIFFRDLFENARDGAMFIFSETNPRAWPDFFKMMEAHCPYMQIGFNKNGHQMMLRKGSNRNQMKPLISQSDRRLLCRFEDIHRLHERKMTAGWERQEQKR